METFVVATLRNSAFLGKLPLNLFVTSSVFYENVSAEEIPTCEN